MDVREIFDFVLVTIKDYDSKERVATAHEYAQNSL
jgi:hypothetical protein